MYIAVSARGEVEAHEGWLSRKEAKRLARGTSESSVKPSRPELTAPLQNYIDLHRHAAVRATLANHPGVALRLAVAHMIAGSPLWRVQVEPQRAASVAVAESIETCAAEGAFDALRRNLIPLLGCDPEAPTLTGSADWHNATDVFRRLLGLSDDEVLAILAVVMGETLAAGSATVDAVGVHLAVDMAAYWQPEDACFDLIRDRRVLTAIMGEVAGEMVAAANAGGKIRTQKAVIRDCLAGSNGRPKVENWLPRWLCFPPRTYTERGERSTV